MNNVLRWIFLIFVCAAIVAAPRVLAADHPDREIKECPDCPQMVAISAGGFMMGSPAHEPGRFDSEGPQHHVTIKAFALGKYDVTSEEFLTFLRETAYQPKPCNPLLYMRWQSPGDGKAYAPSPAQIEPPRWPAVCLDWRDAHAYIDWINKKARAERPALASKPGPYRLPSESEWEYAARGGTATARWWGAEIGHGNANCNGCGSEYDSNTLADVDDFAANPFGLYGMLGNAWQWTEDCWHPSYVGAPANGSAWMSGACDKHVIRGGAWNNLPAFVRSAARSGAVLNGGEFDYSSLAGFRVARDLP
jgi:formylglycine-generating enzyme required for sulfatase activity